MKKLKDVRHHKVQGHLASFADIAALHSVIVPLYKLGLASINDILYIGDIMKTMVMIDSFAEANGSDSKLMELIEETTKKI